MVGERGPHGNFHIPRYRDGCYYSRIADCCWACFIRKLTSSTTSPVRRRLEHAQRDREHEAVGSRIVVPDLRQSADQMSMSYTEGVVSEVYLLDGDEPDIVTVDLTDGDRMYLDLTINDQKAAEESGV